MKKLTSCSKFPSYQLLPASDNPGRAAMLKLSLLCTALLLLTGCSDDWGWYVVDPTTAQGKTNLRFLMSGLYYTVMLSLTAIVISICVGLLVALPGLSTNRALRGFNRVYVELVRAVPILVMILWVYYGLPQLLGITITVFWAGVIALALSDSAFEAEIFRAGIQSIDKGQYEASHTIALSYLDTMRFVILPQAVRRILPALGNQLVYMLKMSSLVSVIGMQELTRKANELVVTEYRPLESYTVLLLEYLVLILIVSAGVRWLERRLKTNQRAT
jgi:polar amino acid transport system permease protein